MTEEYTNTLYTVQKITKDDKMIGPIHGSNTADWTLCGLKVNMGWYIVNNTWDGEITCEECKRLLQEKGFAVYRLP
jgi:RNA polymerase subunit RPABC4/transcription elongation factor Spt4